ncbi:potassium channel family protein [Sphingomonas lacunae]|uniref:Potassium channel family protein n=1 Tax=Sphingomonas lacunae TaxID=2698828 RepID=A0A6M4ARE1_9SPHN|nr:potassium channel family protein [Sphingomonas lacunae]QJQ31605.1 potassium channel family protein [Sphingomonas lacunae]
MTSPRIPRPHNVLRRQSQTPVWKQILWRVLAVVGLIALAIAVHWYDRDGLKDNHDGVVSFLDIIYFTSISISTTGYGDIVPVTTEARMFDALIVTPIRIFVVLIFLGTAYNFVLKRTWERWQMRRIQQRLTGHMIVCGYGISNRQAVQELILRGTSPDSIVVIERDEDALAEAEETGCNVMLGDATRDQVLLDARIDTASAVIISAGRDDTSILMVLTARALRKDVPVSVVIRAQDNESIAHAAGASTVINPVSFTGLLLAGSTHGEHVADYLADLASVDGEVSLRERAATAADIGKPLSALSTGIGVRIYRDGTALPISAAARTTIQPGDMLVEIVQIAPPLTPA